MERASNTPLKSLALALLLGLASAVSAVEQAPADASPEAQFASELSTLLATLEKEAPYALKGLDAKAKARIVSALLTASGSGIEVMDGKTPGAEAPRKELEPAQAFPPPIALASDKVLYLRLDQLDGASASKLKEELAASAKQPKRPLGIALDLRNCSGGTCADALSVFEALDRKTSPAEGEDIHLAALIGPKSSGAVEILAALLERERLALLIGAPTAGLPFSVKTVKSPPYTLAVPEIPGRLAALRQSPVKPSIELPAYPQSKIDALRSTKTPGEDDLCLARAIDLLISIDAIKRKWKKN